MQHRHPAGKARGKVGDAVSERLDARELVDFAARWMTTHFHDLR